MEITEFEEKYKFAVKETKKNILTLVNFDEFINSNEWNSFTDAERFFLLETILNFNIEDKINQNNIIFVENGVRYSKWNYGDYESLMREYFVYKPININEFAEKYPFLIDKIEKDLLFFKDYDNVINKDCWQNLPYENQKELLNIIQDKIIDEAKKNRLLPDQKKSEKRLKYKLPSITINCNDVSEKWKELSNKYWEFNKYTLDEDKPEIKEEQITYFGNEYYKLLKENTPETKGFINKVLDILISLGADEKIKFIESRIRVQASSIQPKQPEIKETKLNKYKEHLTNQDFIKGNIKFSIYKRDTEKKTLIFEIRKGKEKRKFDASLYLELHLENYLNTIDDTDNNFEKQQIIDNAELDIMGLITKEKIPEKHYKDTIKYLNIVKEYIKKRKEIPITKKGKQPEQSNPKELKLNDILEKQNILIPNVSIKEVYEHFKTLTSKVNNSNKHILTDEQLLLFIKSTFIDVKPIKQKWNSHLQTKKEVRYIFYEFYKKYKSNEKNQKNLKQKYFDILNNSFERFNEKNDYTDFSKP